LRAAGYARIGNPKDGSAERLLWAEEFGDEGSNDTVYHVARYDLEVVHCGCAGLS